VRLPIIEVGQTDLAGKPAGEIRASTTAAAGPRLDQFRGAAPVPLDAAQTTEIRPKIIADQQGHGMRTHIEEYVQSEVAERKAEAAKLYADFMGVFRKRG